MISELYAQIIAAEFLDWLALLTSLAYVILAARSNNWCWLFAAVSTAVWAYQSYFAYNLVSDALLQVFYFVMAGVGLWRWRRHAVEQAVSPVRKMTAAEHGITLGGGLCGGLLLGFFFSNTLKAAATYPDAITTVFSIITTFLLVGRRLENWLYWIVIDLAYVWIYHNTGAVLFALMMVINIGIAAYGFVSWQKEWSGQAAKN
ncbi:MAG: nicotinamide riboside transporter PnuC [Bacteroidota bacterium]